MPSCVYNEKHYTIPELSKMWGLSVDTIRALFESVPGVLTISRPETMHKRRYNSLRIPDSVARMVYAKHISTR
jgi:hypothetical protein